MIKCFLLHDRHVPVLVGERAFDSPLVSLCRAGHAADDVDLWLDRDCRPSYAGWAGAIGFAAALLTIWEHADTLVGGDHAAFLRTDVLPRGDVAAGWGRVHRSLEAEPNRPVGLTASARLRRSVRASTVPAAALSTPATDRQAPWGLIRKLDPNLYDWALADLPALLDPQFAVARAALDGLGEYLMRLASGLRLGECRPDTAPALDQMAGLWLVRNGGEALHTTTFWRRESTPVGVYRHYKPLAGELAGERQEGLLDRVE